MTACLDPKCSGSCHSGPFGECACQQPRDDFRVCSCIALDHDHEPNRCEEPPTYRGGTCTSCRLWAYHRGIEGATDDETES